MSPEIRADGKLVADVPDETGDYLMLDGSPLHIDVDMLDAYQEKQLILLNGPAIGGKRIVGLTLEGRGNSGNTKKGGDGKEPSLDVTLHDRPIRVTYSPRIKGTERLVETSQGITLVGYARMSRNTLRNPRWTRGHGQR